MGHGAEGASLRSPRQPSEHSVGYCESLTKLVDTFYGRLLRYAASISAPHDAEDLLHDLYATLPVILGDGRDVRDPFAYMCACLRRLHANRRRKGVRRASIQHTWHRSSGPGPDDFSRMLMTRLEAECILEKLPSKEERLLRLRYLEGLTMIEIASDLDVSAPAARKRLERALLKARQIAHWIG